VTYDITSNENETPSPNEQPLNLPKTTTIVCNSFTANRGRVIKRECVIQTRNSNFQHFLVIGKEVLGAAVAGSCGRYHQRYVAAVVLELTIKHNNARKSQRILLQKDQV
jgi:hypothetical protein